MDNLSRTIDVLVDRMEVTCCEHCNCEIDVSDLTLFDQIICPECNIQGSVPCKLGPYIMQDRIGSGAMGTVYKAKDEFLEREVAIKVLKKRLGGNKTSIEKFKREAMAIAQLNHPNIAQIYAFGEQDEQPYIVMEYLPGDTLKDMMSKKKQLDQALVLKTGINIAGALEAASEVRIVHGDVKPENITFDDKGNAKLVDFGIATFDYGGGEKGIFGTPYYIAPENLTPGGTDTRADMYSLGATLFHALTGRPPFTSPNNSPMECAKMRLTHNAPPLSRFRRSINPEINKIVLRMIEREPGRRHPTYTSLIHDMQKTLQGLTDNPQQEPTPSQRSKSTSTTEPKRTVRTKPSRIKVQATTKPQSSKASTVSSPKTSRGRTSARASSRQAPQKSSSPPIALFIVIGIIVLAVGIVVITHVQKKRVYRALVANYQYGIANHIQTAANHVAEIDKQKKIVSSKLEQLKIKAETCSPSVSLALQREMDPNKKIISAAQKRAENIARDIERFSTKVTAVQAAIPGSRNLQAAAAGVDDLKGIIKPLKAFGTEADELISEVREANVSNLRLITDHKAAELAKAKEEESKKKAEAIAKEREERMATAQLKNQQEKEKKLADLQKLESRQFEEAKKRITALIKINEFDMAFETLIKLRFKTDESIKNRLMLKTKISRLTQWKHWIATQLSTSKIKDGWVANGRKYDITQGNETGLKITGGFVPWKNVPPLKLLALFNYFIMKEQQLDNTTKANYYFAAMIYCSDVGVYQGVEKYLDKAAEFDPSLRGNPETTAMLTAARDVLATMPEYNQPPKETKKIASKIPTVVSASFTKGTSPENIKLGPDIEKKFHGLYMDKSKDLTLSLDIDNGLYEVFFTVTRNYWYDLLIKIESEEVASGVRYMATANNIVVGPFITQVADKELNISLQNRKDSLTLRGLEIYRLPNSWSADQAIITKALLSSKKLANGLRYKYFKTNALTMPDFSEIRHEEQGRADGILHKVPNQDNENYAISQNGYIGIPVGGRYSFKLASNDAGRLYIDGKLIVDNNYPQDDQATICSIHLAQGKHRIETEYFQLKRTSSFDVTWRFPNSTTWTPIPPKLLYCIVD